MLVAIVGCGNNSSCHINFAMQHPSAKIIAIVDKDTLKRNACAARYRIPGAFSSISEMVSHSKPDVVHIVTPPSTHYSLAREAIQLKCNVLIEKPMVLNLRDALELYELADRNNVKICPMHNHYFDPCLVKSRDIIKRGVLGDIIGIDASYGTNPFASLFRTYPSPNVLPWIYELPGGPCHDILPHLLYPVLPLTGKIAGIRVISKSHQIFPGNMPDEIRILIDGEISSASLTVSFAARPHLHYMRFYGSKAMMESNIDTMTTVIHKANRFPKAAQKALYNISESWQLASATMINAAGFISGRLKSYQGLKTLIHRYYDSLDGNGECPVTKDQALQVIACTEEILKQLAVAPPGFAPVASQNKVPAQHKETIMVTGGTGFIGKRTVELLIKEGYPVRVLARKLSGIEPLKKLGAEIFFGDIADTDSLDAALKNVDIVVHAAAGTSGSKEDSEQATIIGTKNILDLCSRNNIKKLIYISSLAVYGIVDYKDGLLVNEESSLERFPSKRGNYSDAKYQAEKLVRDAMRPSAFPIVVLRPGIVYGSGGDALNSSIGFSLTKKMFIILGSGNSVLPLIYVDDLADAIIKSIEHNGADNKVFNVVDGEKVPKKQYVNCIIKRIYPGAFVIYLPHAFLYSLIWAHETFSRILRIRPLITRYKYISSQKQVHYDNSNICQVLQWHPRSTFREKADIICGASNR